MKRLIALNAVYTFMSSALTFLVPLYLLDRGVSIEQAGFLVALGSLTFGVLRVILASMADEVGTWAVNLLCSLSSAASVLIYMFWPSSPGFFLAGIAGGVHSSAFWAVVRTDPLNSHPSDPAKALATLAVVRQLADGIARLSIGVMLTYLAFQGTFGLMLALAVAFGAFLFLSPPKISVPAAAPVLEHIFHRRPATFWQASAILMLLWLSVNTLSGFLLPVYFVKGAGMSYDQAGFLLALLSLATAILALLSMRWNLDKQALSLAVGMAAPALVAIPFLPLYLLPLLLVVAFSSGCANIITEYILADQVYRSKNPSADIGAIFVPLKVAEFILLSASGFMIASFGFGSVFAACALFLAIFAAAGFILLRRQ